MADLLFIDQHRWREDELGEIHRRYTKAESRLVFRLVPSIVLPPELVKKGLMEIISAKTKADIQAEEDARVFAVLDEISEDQ